MKHWIILKIVRNTLETLKLKISSIRAEPNNVALGYALGIFLAASPFIGIKVFIAIPLSILLKWNKMAALIGIFHINPLTGPVFYGFSFVVGKTILGENVELSLSWPLWAGNPVNLFTTQLALFICLLIGGVVLGLPVSLLAYYVVKKFLSHRSQFNPQIL